MSFRLLDPQGIETAPCDCEMCRAGVTRAAHGDASHDRRLDQRFAIGPHTLRILGGTTKCARLLIGHVLARPEAFGGRSVIELGAGAGLVGLGLAHGLGCAVDATDQEPALDLLTHNIAANGDPAPGSIRAVPLQWGAEAASARAGSHDLVVGADLNFARENLEPLRDTLIALCRQPGQAILLATIVRAQWEAALPAALDARYGAGELLADAGDARLWRWSA